MKFGLPIILLAITVALMGVGLYQAKASASPLGVASGSALPGLTAKAETPEQSLAQLLTNLQRRNWSLAFSSVSPSSGIDQSFLIADWSGSDGSLRTFSNLESYDLRPLHVTDSEAQIRARLRWSTPVGPVEDVRDFHLVHEANAWKTVWPKSQTPNVPAQVVAVPYLRWDLVTGSASDEWGSHSVDAPHVRIISMNAVNTPKGAAIMGEVVNEDTIPAFVNVNATLVDAAGKNIDEESSFDKIAHILLPKQVSPYRVDFPDITLDRVKNVSMDVRATLVPASADPVVGVMNQKIETDAQGNPVLHGDLLNQSGRTVNIPHVIASFYDNNGKVVWVADGYVDRALEPLGSQHFAVDLPRNLADKVHGFHVVVNQYSVGRT